MDHIIPNPYYFYKYIFIGAFPADPHPPKNRKIVDFWSDRGFSIHSMPDFRDVPHDGKNSWRTMDFPKSTDYSRFLKNPA
jgi:hypothetical protein